MKAICTITLATCLFSLILPESVQARAGKKKDKDQFPNARKILKKYGSNGVIHPGPESDALRKAFETDKRLKHFDTNNDGKLDNNEIAAIKPKHIGRKKKSTA